MQSSTSRFVSRFASQGIGYFKGKDKMSQEECCKVLAQFQGGSVDLNMDNKTGIATICLNRPDKKNAMSGQMMIELDEAAKRLENWGEGKGFILHGAGGTFCSGGDLAMSKSTATPELGWALSRFVQNVTTKLKTLPLVSVAFINGVALGGGAEIATAACDWRILTEDAKIGFVHGRMGLTAGWGGGVALCKLVGSSRALDLITSSKLVMGSEAIVMGLANAVVSSAGEGDELTLAKEWLSMRTSADVEVIRAAKALMIEDYYCPLHLELESRLHAPLWGGKAKIAALEKNIKHK